MKTRQLLAGAVIATTMAFASPTVVRAQEESSKSYDARLEGYNGNVTLSGSGTALTWLFMLVLTGITVGVLFKDAKRSHLD